MQEPAEGRIPTPMLWPRWGDRDRTGADPVRITVYVVSGRHEFVTGPEEYCRECHLFVRAADVAAGRVDVPTEVSVVSWWTRFQ